MTRDERLVTGDNAPNVTLVGVEGHEVALGSLWANGTTLLTFLRHFGCSFCRQWLSKLEARQAELTQAGLQVVALAMGQPKHAAHYCGRLAPSLRCLTQETSAPYIEYGLTQAGLGQFFTPTVLIKGLGAAAEGFVPKKVFGDIRMLPGSFLVDRAGVVRWAHYAQDVSDHPRIDAIIEASQGIKAH